jgi:hypothetical protein
VQLVDEDVIGLAPNVGVFLPDLAEDTHPLEPPPREALRAELLPGMVFLPFPKIYGVRIAAVHRIADSPFFLSSSAATHLQVAQSGCGMKN